MKKLGLFLLAPFLGISTFIFKSSNFDKNNYQSTANTTLNSNAKKSTISGEKDIIWENDGSHGEPGWREIYEFGLDGTDPGLKCLATFPQKVWDKIKTETFCLDVEIGGNPNIRVTTGWWSSTWPEPEYNNADDLILNEDGTYRLEINFVDHEILDIIDEQHLLFTGGDYIPLRLYFVISNPKTTFWENDGSYGEVSWDKTYSFGLIGTDDYSKCLLMYPESTWGIMKNQTIYLDLEAIDPQIQVTTYDQSVVWTDEDIIIGNELLVDNEDGTFTLEINFTEDDIYNALDDKHLLFTGVGYTPLKLYFDPIGPKPKPDVIWENDGSHGSISWSGEYRFGLDGTDLQSECIKTFPQDIWDKIRNGTFYLDLEATNPQIRVTTGWWSTTWTGDDIFPGNDRLVDNGDGTFTLEINFAGDSILDLIDEQHLLFTGGEYTPLRLYFLSSGPAPVDDTIWENDGSHEDPSWGGIYRFCSVDYATGEELYAFNSDIWERLKTETFYLDVEISDFSDAEIRVTTSLWNPAWPSTDYNNVQDLIPNEDGTYRLEINFEGHEILDAIDEQHLLFTGQLYTPLRLYFKNDGSNIINEREESESLINNGYLDINKSNAFSGDTVTITPEPLEGYRLAKDSLKVLFGEGESCELAIGKNEQFYTFIMPDVDVTVTAEFETYVSSISMKSSPTKVEYKVGEDLDLSGARITINYANGDVEDIDVTSSMVSGYDKNKVGTQTITVTYEDKTTSFDVTVVDSPVPPTPGDGGLSTGAIVGIALGSAVALGGLIVLIIILAKKNDKDNKK